MKLTDITDIEAIERFLDGTQPVVFSVQDRKDDRYRWVEDTLRKLKYRQLGKPAKGIVIRFLMKVSGYSRQQITRLIAQYAKHNRIIRRQRTTHGFRQRYTNEDKRLLAKLDGLHQTPSGPVVKKLCERAYHRFGDDAYERFASISASHIYNLRRSRAYQQERQHFEKTKPKRSNIGVRRKPKPDGQPGFLRVDTVHQGDLDKIKGVYHLNVVDEVTQFEVVFCTEKISETFLIPALTEIFSLLPFQIKGFHADNGSEYINHQVAKLLSKMSIELTKSRARQTNDNALAESKNASVVRKNFGYQHIPQHWAKQVNDALMDPLFHYLNFHRPCFFPRSREDHRGKIRKTYHYDDMMTPYDKLKSLDNASSYLKPGISFASLDRVASAETDNECALRLQTAKQAIFARIFEETRSQNN